MYQCSDSDPDSIFSIFFILGCICLILFCVRAGVIWKTVPGEPIKQDEDKDI